MAYSTKQDNMCRTLYAMCNYVCDNTNHQKQY